MDDGFVPGMVIGSGFIIVLLVVFLSLFDFREFITIKKQCETQGFIQNYTTRINCSLEK